MTLRTITFTLGCLAIATRIEAGTILFGPSIAFPISAGDVRDNEPGLDLGVTIHNMVWPHFGVGADLAYHYWSASPEYMAAYDRYLRTGWFQALDTPTWSFSAIQISGHVKLVVPAIHGHAPWVQIGCGVFHVNRNLAEPNWEGSVVSIRGGGPKRRVIVPGVHAGIGIDFRTSSTTVLGVNATFQRLLPQSEATVWGDMMPLPGFSAVTVGTQILFGR